MKNPLEIVVIPGGILLLAFLSALLLPAPAFGLELSKRLITWLHIMDLNQLYTIVFALWFLLLGSVEFFAIRFVWRRLSKTTHQAVSFQVTFHQPGTTVSVLLKESLISFKSLGYKSDSQIKA